MLVHELNVPPGSKIVLNNLYTEMGKWDFTEDIACVKLPSGIYLDVGWYPEDDPNGEFVIKVFKEEWECITGVTREIPHLLRLIKLTAFRYAYLQ